MPETELKPDQERVKNLLTDTVTLLCRNSLTFRDRLRIEGLLGVSIDNSDVFFVHISENFEQNSSADKPAAEETEAAMFTAPASPAKSTRKPRESPCPSPSRQSQLSPASSPAQVKAEPVEDVDDLLIVEEPKQEVFTERARQASMVAGQRRAARRREHSPLVQQHQGGWDDMGEPAAKRHMSTDSDSENNGGGQGSSFGQVDENVGWPDMSDFNQGHMFQQDPGGSSFDTTTPGCSTWPTTVATQQQAQDTTGSRKKLPESGLSSSLVRNALAQYVVNPTFRRDRKFLAFRLMWTSKNTPNLEDVWLRITQNQYNACEHLKQMPGVDFFLSTITATTTWPAKTINPGLCFWVRINPQVITELEVYTLMRNNALGAELKIMRATGAEINEDNPKRQLYNIAMAVKDYGPGLIQDRIASVDPEYIRQRLYMKDSHGGADYLGAFYGAQKALADCGLYLYMETY